MLQEVRHKTKTQAMTGEDQAHQLAIYARDLSEYPADCVRLAIKAHLRSSPWWPTWHELVGVLDHFSAYRRALLEALTQEPTP